MNNVVIGT